MENDKSLGPEIMAQSAINKEINHNVLEKNKAQTEGLINLLDEETE